MDLGIRDRWAIVCASSRGLGKACAVALASEGVHLIINGTNRAVLLETAAEIRALSSVEVVPVLADVATKEGRAALHSACGSPDILINNAGGPPAGNFRSLSREQWLDAIEMNMLAPIEMTNAVVDGMIARRFGRIVNITSSSVKAPISYLGLSNGARSGLTGFMAGVATEISQFNVTINNILPGSFETDRLRESARQVAVTGQEPEQVLEHWRASETSRRFGNPSEFGALCAFLCSGSSGYITKQNIMIDGGSYAGAF